MASLTAIHVVLRQLWPFRAAEPQSAATALHQRLLAGAPLGDALAQVAGALASAAVASAAARFESGAVALFLVDVRDGLQRQVVEAGQQAQARRDLPLATSLADVSRRLGDDTFVQHLINTLLDATGLYSEALPLQLTPRLTARCVDAVTGLLGRSWCVLLTRSDAARLARHPSGEEVALPTSIARG